MQVNAAKETANFLMEEANVSTLCFHALCLICENIAFLSIDVPVLFYVTKV